MAKKKKSAKRKSAKAEAVVKERSPFLDYSGAVVLMLLAIFMLLGGFGTGGPLPVNLFHSFYWALGWAAYMVPVALLYWGFIKFSSEDRKLPLGKFVSLLVTLLFASSWFYTAFASQRAYVWNGGHGGAIGKGLGGAVLGALDKLPASLLFTVCGTS